MRSALVALGAFALSGTLACTALDSPTAPTAAMLALPRAASPARQIDPFDISGSWVTSEFVHWGTLPESDDLVYCQSYAIIENEEWNSVLLEQDGPRISGTSRPGMGISCWAYTPDGVGVSWFVDIDDVFEGQVTGASFAFRCTNTSRPVSSRIRRASGGSVPFVFVWTRDPTPSRTGSNSRSACGRRMIIRAGGSI